MRLLTLIIILTSFSLASYSQKTLRYSGDYFNGERIKGSANFAYYLNKKNEKVKNGPFRYSAREKGKTWRFSQNISGEYIKGNKDGDWTYNLNSKEVKKDRDGYFYDITVDMTAKYDKGFPKGKWEYDCIISRYKKEMKSGRLRKTAATNVKDLKIILNWKKGKLVDSLIIIDKLSSNIIVSMNKMGVLSNNLIIDNNKVKSITKYSKGVEVSQNKVGKSFVNLEYQEYSSLEDKENRVRKIKNSLFAKPNCIIEKYLTENIFNNEYFLYRFIEGDKLLHSNNQYNDYSITYNGLYYYTLEPKTTIEEEKILKEIDVALEKTNEAFWYNKRALAKSPKDKSLLADRQRINFALTKYEDIYCYLSVYKKYLNLLNIQNHLKCKNLNFETQPISRIEFLYEIKHQSDLQYRILSTHNQYH